MADETGQISEQTVTAFANAPKEAQAAALAKMSLDTKRSLLVSLRARGNRPAGLPEGVGLPTVPAAPNPILGEQPASAEASHIAVEGARQTGEFGKEAGRQLWKAGTGFLEALGEGASNVEPTPARLHENQKEREKRLQEHPEQMLVGDVKHDVGVVGSAAKDVVTAPFHAARGKDSVMQEYDPSWASRAEMFASSILGGDPEAARRNFAKGEYGAGQADLVAVPAAGYALSKIPGVGTVEKSAAATGSDAARQLERLASIQSPTGVGIDTYAVAQDVQPLLKQWMSEQGYTNSTLNPRQMGGVGPRELPIYGTSKGPFPLRKGFFDRTVEKDMFDVTGQPTKGYVQNLRQGARNVLDAANGAVDVADRPFQKMIGEYGTESASSIGKNGEHIAGSVQQQTHDRLMKAAEMYDNPADQGISAAIRKQADEVLNAKNLGELQAIKARANQGISSLLKGSPSQQMAAGYSNAVAWKVTGDAIRDFMYPKLEELSGLDLRAFGRREASAMRFRDGVYGKYFSEIDPAQASEAAKGFLGGLKNDVSHHHGWKAKVLGKSPTGEFNESFRKGVGELGEGAQGENVRIEGQSRPALPAPADMKPHTFKIPTGLPQEIIEGGTAPEVRVVKPEERVYAGTQEVPNPNYTPLEGPSYRTQRQQLGTTAETIPESVRGARSDAQVRKDTAPVGAPDQAFTGHPTVTQAQWKETPAQTQFVPGKSGEVTRTGGGVMETPDFKTAFETLGRMKKVMRSAAFDKLPAAEREATRQAAMSLQQQVTEYMAAQAAKAPRAAIVDPYSPGIVRRKRTGRAMVTTGAAANSTRSNENQ